MQDFTAAPGAVAGINAIELTYLFKIIFSLFSRKNYRLLQAENQKQVYLQVRLLATKLPADYFLILILSSAPFWSLSY